MPLQHHSAFGPVVYSPHADYLLKNVLVYPHKYLPTIHIPSPDLAVFDNDEWQSQFQPHHHSLTTYSPPRIKQEDLPLYPAIPTYPSAHELLVHQPHRSYGLDHHHDSFALFEGHHHSIPSQHHSTYYSPPFQNSIPHQQPHQISRSSFDHQQSHQPVVPLSAAYVRPAEVSPSAADMVLGATIELDVIDASAVGGVSAMNVIAPIQDDAVEGNEEDAEGEDDWGQIGPHDSDHEGGTLGQPIESVPPGPSEECSTASTSSSDEDFNGLTSEEDDEEEVDDDDDDDEFVLNPRQRQHRSMSTVDTRRRSRGGISGISGTGSSANAATLTASELTSNGFFPFSISDDSESKDETKPTVPTTPGRRRTRPPASFGVPVPVPNLTKKSRGRRVPTMSSLEDLRSAASGAGKKRQNAGGKSARMYLCDVEGCGKCFARGEHLKRHVRSIHTYEKPHKCPYPGCGKDFSRHDNLGQHMRVHKDYTPPASTSMRRKAQQA